MDSNFKKTSKEQLIFSGISLNPGIAMGNAFILKNLDIQQIIKNKHTIEIVEAEYAKVDFALQKTKKQFSLSIENAKKSNRSLMDSIFNAYLYISEDTALLNEIKKNIKKKYLNCESVLAEEIFYLRQKILKSGDGDKLKLMNTFQDIYYRLLYNWSFWRRPHYIIKKSRNNSILISDRLTPIEVGLIPTDKVKGIVLEEATKN